MDFARTPSNEVDFGVHPKNIYCVWFLNFFKNTNADFRIKMFVEGVVLEAKLKILVQIWEFQIVLISVIEV
jgi:hypothetical protein